MVGYDKVVDMANRAGMNYKIQPTPAVALGAYEITPLEAAGAYTMFANSGDYVKPSFLSHGARAGRQGRSTRTSWKSSQVLDPRVAYLMTNLMEEVLRTGTAAGVRARYNFNVPAAGKTGTSHDGWFAGYTSELLCVVWVGFDDNRELDLEGAHSAAPIWAEFMKQALQYPGVSRHEAVRAPDGIVSIAIDPQSGMPATPSCPTRPRRKFISPGRSRWGPARCMAAAEPVTNVAGWDVAPPPPSPADSAPRVTGSNGDGQVQPSPVARRAARRMRSSRPRPPKPADPPQEPKKTEKKGIFRRLWVCLNRCQGGGPQ